MLVPIKTALISVSDKTGIAEFCRFLASKNVEILSTGGTAELLRKENIPVRDVSDYTGFPEMMDGRVKTLHPKIHGGLLGKRDDKEHIKAMEEHAIQAIDLVVISLYPFEQVVAKGADYDTVIENIDIGGPSMIRSAAKNHSHVTVLVHADDYARVTEEMSAHDGATTLQTRKELAAKAYARTAVYDVAIANWMHSQGSDAPAPTLLIAAQQKQVLRYGENPHQKAASYVTSAHVPSLLTARQVQGKELSYNNLNDTNAALALVREFVFPAAVIVKHANPCGVAVGDSIAEAYGRALKADSQSAFGGIIALNRPLDVATAEQIAAIFSEVIIAPDAEEGALAVFEKKKNLRVLLTGDALFHTPAEPKITSVSGGFLMQDANTIVYDERENKLVTKRAPTEQELKDLLFAFTVVKHVKSNAIVLARDHATVGIGAGQMSRVDSVRLSIHKARELGHSLEGAALASDAFFPFDDNIGVAAEAGIKAIIQPGGSVRDDEVIAAAEKHGMAMLFTGIRHFNH